MGILLYTIVYKENPFYNIGNMAALKACQFRSLRLAEEILDHPLRVPYLPFSEDCIDLIRRMLERDVEQRVTIEEVKDHPFLKDD